MYHARAWRAGARWAPFRRQLAEWLAAWAPAARELVLIGPSGGHTLPTAWLRRFTEVDAYDLDPLAGPLFKLRHRGVAARFHRRDVFWRDGRLATRAMDDVLARHPDAAILFTNVLGQVLLERSASELEWSEFLNALAARLRSRTWASYHDRFSHAPDGTVDHLTGGPWTAGLRQRRLEWWLTPSSRHEIDAVYR